MSQPHSKESESALLGALILDSSLIDNIDLQPEDFFYTDYQEIYRAIKLLGEDADAVSVSEVLQRQGMDWDILKLTALTRECPSIYNYDTYVKIIRDTSSRRAVIRHAERLAKAAFDEESNLSDAISQTMTSLVSSVRSSGGAVHISNYLTQLYEQVEERAKDPKLIYGLETGIRDFDKITHGLQKQEQFIIAGAPGTGKSLLAFQLACGMSENGHPGAVYELEMTGVAVIRRRTSALSKLPTYNLLSGVSMNENWEEFAKAIEKMEQYPIYLSEESNWNTLQLRADLARLKKTKNIEYFIVDYMDLLSDSYGANEIDRTTYISHQLKAICKDLELAGITLQSVTKEGYGSTSMKAVSGSNKVIHDADQIVIISQDSDEPNVVNLTWEKMRESDGDRMMKLVKIPGLPDYEQYVKEEEVKDYYWND